MLTISPLHSYTVRNSLRYVVRVRVRGSSLTKNSVREGVYIVGTLWVRCTSNIILGEPVCESTMNWFVRTGL